MVIGVCEVCKENESKYKCPVCNIKFCCVACFKIHKASEQCTKPVVEEKPVERKEVEFETEDTVVPEKLDLLELELMAIRRVQTKTFQHRTKVLKQTTTETVFQKIKKIVTDENIKNDLNNPHLRQLLTKVNFSGNLNKTIREAMQEPMFVDFVTHCLKLVEDPERYENNYVA